MEPKKLPKGEIKRHIEEILKGEFPEIEEAILGENRGQLLVRIPKQVSERMKLRKGQKVRFIVTSPETGKNELKLEAV
jgi:hypothetical protein